MSTAQDGWDDRHRNHEKAPKEADTAEPMSAEELFNIGQKAAREAGGKAADQVWAELDSDIKEWLTIFALFMREQIRQAEQAAYDIGHKLGWKHGRTYERRKALEERDKEWKRWLAETQIATAEREFDIETAIMCGGKPTLHDAAQVGYAAGMFVWEAACKERLKALSTSSEPGEDT